MSRISDEELAKRYDNFDSPSLLQLKVSSTDVSSTADDSSLLSEGSAPLGLPAPSSALSSSWVLFVSSEAAKRGSLVFEGMMQKIIGGEMKLTSTHLFPGQLSLFHMHTCDANHCLVHQIDSCNKIDLV